MSTITKTKTGVTVKLVILTENDNYVLQNYGKLTSFKICEHLGIEMKDYRGITSKLSKLGLIETPVSKKLRELKEQKEVKNSFNNHDGVQKRIARDLVITEINDSNLVGKVLGLPFKNATFERQLLSDVSKDFTFVGCEHNQETYFNMLQTVIDNRLPMSCINGELIDTINNSKRDEYAHIFADFCGQFDTYRKDIKTIFKNKLVKVGGIVAITLANRNSSKNSLISTLNELNPLDSIEGSSIECGVKTYLLKKAKFNFALTKVFTYKDDEKQSMILYILKRVR